MRDRLVIALLLAAAVLVAAGGFIHLREWLDTYRNVPAAVPGASVVRVGFPLNAAASLVIAGALLATAWRLRRFVMVTVISAIAFQAASLGVLILSRTGDVFGWTERGWMGGAQQARAVEIAALVALVGALAVGRRTAALARDPVTTVH